MKIILVRHAKVMIDESKKLKARQLKSWVDRYDYSPIERQSLPDLKCKKLLEESSFIVASKRSRTSESLNQIGFTADLLDEKFNEVEVANAGFPFFNMKAKNHLIASRILMLVPFGKPYHFLQEEKKRANAATTHLETLAHEYASVALVGHGAMNFLMARVLKNRGWSLVEKGGGTDNWSYKVWEKI